MHGQYPILKKLFSNRFSIFILFCGTEPGVVEYAAAASTVVRESNHSAGVADGDQWHVDNAHRKYDAEHGGQFGDKCDECGGQH